MSELDRDRPPHHGLLAAIAVLLGLNLLATVSGTRLGVAAAHAQPVRQDRPGTDNVDQPGDIPFNATAQRKTMIAHLDQMNARLARIEGQLERGVNVRVTEMPEIKFPERRD
ncbi:MAG TPA: hypothetical protein VD963_01690 [Phycisphaerales bacterium]|nr:hypothetical protein [Phycisphaerales bacterium]